MNREEIRKVAVAIDCSPHSKAALEAAAAIAEGQQAELAGIFVEDINLRKIEGLLRRDSASGKFDDGALEELFREQARQARELLQRTADAKNLRNSFSVLRGLVPEVLISAAQEAGLLVLGRSGRSPSCRKGLGSAACASLYAGNGDLLLMQPGFSAADWPMLVLHDGSEASKRALQSALAIARPTSTLHLIPLDPSPYAIERCRAVTEPMIGPSGLAVEYHHMPFTTAKQLVRYIRMIDSGLLVLSDRMEVPVKELWEVVTGIDYPVLLIR